MRDLTRFHLAHVVQSGLCRLFTDQSAAWVTYEAPLPQPAVAPNGGDSGSVNVQQQQQQQQRRPSLPSPHGRVPGPWQQQHQEHALLHQQAPGQLPRTPIEQQQHVVSAAHPQRPPFVQQQQQQQRQRQQQQQQRHQQQVLPEPQFLHGGGTEDLPLAERLRLRQKSVAATAATRHAQQPPHGCKAGAAQSGRAAAPHCAAAPGMQRGEGFAASPQWPSSMTPPQQSQPALPLPSPAQQQQQQQQAPPQTVKQEGGNAFSGFQYGGAGSGISSATQHLDAAANGSARAWSSYLAANGDPNSRGFNTEFESQATLLTVAVIVSNVDGVRALLKVRAWRC